MPKTKVKHVSLSAQNALDKILRLIPGYDPFETAGDCRFDYDAAQLALDFFPECLTHVEGRLAHEPFELQPWEAAIIANLFGWKRPDGTRRYREALIYVPRKNGKTTLVAGIVNLVLFTDSEPGAQIYSAAAEKEQAAIVFRIASNMVLQEPELDSRARVYKTFKSIELTDGPEMGIYRAISAEAKTKHGFNTHLAVIDELHAQPNRDLVDVLMTSTGSRTQPMIVHITTADFARESICNEKLEYAEKVRDGIVDDDPYFLPVIFAASLDDDWKDEAVWAKVNPNLGVSISLEYLRRECRRAIEQPSYENTFKRLHLNIVTEQSVRWLQMDKWNACDGKVDAEALKGKPCWGALDLSSTSDLTPFVLIFPPEGEGDTYKVLLWCWVPGESMERRARRDKVQYPVWARQGFIEKTEGNVVDYARVRAKINEIGKSYSIQEIAFDPWNATQLAQELGEQDGFEMIEMRQGFITMNEPSKMLERLVLDGKISHGGNPVLKWAASNVTVKTDESGNIRPDKKKSTEKIDPIVALVMALGRAALGGTTGSAYDDYDDDEDDSIEW